MPARLRNLLIKAGGFLLAALLLYLALRGTDLNEIWKAFASADYRWLVPVVAVLLLSHVLRAWRWQLLLAALPADDRNGRVPGVMPAFFSLMIGYMVNYAAPRLGEVARTANLASRQRIAFSSVLGTVVAERVLDVLTLVVALGSVVLLLADRLGAIERLFLAPFKGIEPLWMVVILALMAGVAVLLFMMFRRLLQNRPNAPFLRWTARLKPAVTSFMDGFATLRHSSHKPLILGLTAGMWLLYAIAAYLPFVMLHIAEPFDLSLIDSWSIMVLGSLGVVVPSPGGTGSYHYITVEVLARLFDVDRSPAASYAFITHAAQFILYVVVGLGCMLLQASRPRDFLRADDPAGETVESAADAARDA